MTSVAGRIARDPEHDGWTFACVGPGCAGSDGTPFMSRGWPRKEQAVERARQHLREHLTGADPEQPTELMEPLDVFMARHGLAEVDRASEAWRALLDEGRDD